MKIRRVIVGLDPRGASAVLEDGPAPRTHEYQSLPGFSTALLWATEGAISLSVRNEDATPTASFLPSAGGTRLMVVRMPPDSAMSRADFDAAAYGAEFFQNAPGLAQTFERDNPGMHTTPSLDYDLVLEGEITLELDGGREVVLRRHDVVVQQGARHAWRNRGDQPATMLFVLLGAQAPHR